MNELTFTKKDAIKAVAWLSSYIDSLDESKQYTLTVKEHRKKRSNDANSYAWVLLDKLAEKTGIGKTDIYKQYIKEIGGNSDTVCCIDSAVDKLCASWSIHGIGWLTETMPSKIDGCTNVVLYYGSSTYDTAQMSRLINLIVQDCKEQGIETLTPEELHTMCEEWR